MTKEPITELAIEAVRKYVPTVWNSLDKQEIVNFNGMFAGFDENGTITYEQLKGACHYDLKDKRLRGTHLLVTMLRPSKLNNCQNYHSHHTTRAPMKNGIMVEATRAYHDYLLNRSFMTPHLYVDRDTPELSDPAKLQAYVIKGTAPCNLAAAFCVLTRHPREHMTIVVMWWVLCQHGYDETLALFIAEQFGSGTQSFAKDHELVGINQLIEANFRSCYFACRGHTIFRGGWSNVKTVEAWCAKKPVVVEESVRDAGYSYTGISNVFMGDTLIHNTSDDQMFTAQLAKFINDLRDGIVDTKQTSIINPFTRAEPVNRNTISLSNLLQYPKEISNFFLTRKKEVFNRVEEDY